MSLPSFQRATNCEINPGGSCKSPSSNTQAFLLAISMPLRKAACEPKLREWQIPTTCRSLALISRMTSSLLSGLLSFTKMIS